MAQLYGDEILHSVMLPFLLRHPGLTFQHDNARPHTACVAMNCLQGCRILPWPARSPDLSAIERIWDVLRRWNIDDLVQQLKTIWHEIQQDTIQ